MTKFLIIGSGYKCAQYVPACFDSVRNQTYRNFYFLWIDDGSRDETGPACLKNASGMDCFGFIGRANIGTVMAREFALRHCPRNFLDFHVIVWLDLDDELMPNALEKLAEKYQDPNCWLTYGNFINSSGQIPFNSETIKLDPSIGIREQPFKFMHLRSYRRELYSKLEEKDLLPAMHAIYPDMHMLISLMELAGHDHIVPISEVLYKYNTDNPLAVLKLHSAANRVAEQQFVRTLTPKNQLKSL